MSEGMDLLDPSITIVEMTSLFVSFHRYRFKIGLFIPGEKRSNSGREWQVTGSKERYGHGHGEARLFEA